MIADVLQWVLPILGLTGTYIVGKKNLWGWLLQFAGQILWGVFIVLINKPGLLLGTIAYAFIYGWNFGKWLKEKRGLPGHLQVPAGVRLGDQRVDEALHIPGVCDSGHDGGAGSEQAGPQ